jgi:hypothetical protein
MIIEDQVVKLSDSDPVEMSDVDLKVGDSPQYNNSDSENQRDPDEEDEDIEDELP